MSTRFFAHVSLAFYFLLANNSVLANSDFSYMAADGSPASGIHITGCTNNCQADMVIPEELDGFVVSGIGYSAFHGVPLNSINFPSTITSIADFAFENSGLQTIFFNGARPEIASTAFWDNSIANIVYSCTNVTGWPGEPIEGITPQLHESCDNSDSQYATFDIDQSGSVDALSDGLILLRYFFNFRGEALIAGVISPNANRTSAADIEAYIESHMP